LVTIKSENDNHLIVIVSPLRRRKGLHFSTDGGLCISWIGTNPFCYISGIYLDMCGHLCIRILSAARCSCRWDLHRSANGQRSNELWDAGQDRIGDPAAPDFSEKYRQPLIRVAENCAVKKRLEKPPVFEIVTTEVEMA
jgi:hypothetical protein